MRACKVLILYITPNSGHYRAAVSIQRALERQAPDVEIILLDAFNYTNPILNKIVHKTYIQIIRRKPEVWEYLYDNPAVVQKTQKLKGLIHKYNSRKLINLLAEFQPDVIVCTQAFPCGMIADLKKHYDINIPLIGVLTDYVAHSFWYYRDVNLYIIPDDSTKGRMIQNGIPEEKIKVYGIPISPEFNIPLKKEAILQKLNLKPEIPVILVMGGGRGLGQIKSVVYTLLKIPQDFQILVVCGVNKKLYKYFRRRETKINKIKPFKVFNYIENIYELMSISDVLISKPGGITTAEALAKCLPTIIFNPLPGQEKSNTEFLLKTGAALKSEKITDLPILLNNLFENKYKLRLMSESAQAYRHPDSASKIAGDILKLARKYV